MCDLELLLKDKDIWFLDSLYSLFVWEGNDKNHLKSTKKHYHNEKNLHIDGGYIMNLEFMKQFHETIS